MPNIKPVVDFWMLFSEEFLHLRVSVGSYVRDSQIFLGESLQAAFKPFQFHCVGIRNFVALKSKNIIFEEEKMLHQFLAIMNIWSFIKPTNQHHVNSQLKVYIKRKSEIENVRITIFTVKTCITKTQRDK